MAESHRIVPVHLTRPMATSMNETLSSRSVRIPFRVPSTCHRWRVVLSNVNYRANVRNPGGVTIRTIVAGDAELTASGQLTGAFAAGSESFRNGLEVHRYDELVRDLGETEWTTEWFTNTLAPGRDYLLAYGFRTNRQTMHRGIAGGWWTNGNPLNAELRADPSASRTRRPPLDVRIELALAGGPRTQIVLGDSIAAGSSASFPIREAPIVMASQVDGTVPFPILHTFGGASMPEWIGSWASANSMKWQDVLRYGSHHQVVLALGSNDIHSGKNLARLKTNFTALADLARERIASDIVGCTVTPRSSWAHTEPAKEQVRRQFNDWLAALPEGITFCADTARMVTDATGAAPVAEFVDPDGIHFNSRGSERLARAFLTHERA